MARILQTLVGELSDEVESADGGATQLEIEIVAALRYQGQSDTIEIPSPTLDDPDALGAAFRARHQDLYGFSTDESWELSALRVAVSGPDAAFETARAAEPSASSKTPSKPIQRLCTFEGEGESGSESGDAVLTPCLKRETLVPGDWVLGPAIIEDSWSTVIVPPGDRYRVDPLGHIHIQVRIPE